MGKTLFKKRVKKAGVVSRAIAKSTIWYPLKIALTVLWKVFTYMLSILLTILLIMMITGVVVVCAFLLYIRTNIDAEFDGLANLRLDSPLSSALYYSDGMGNEVVLEGDTLHGSENRLWAEYGEIPQQLINAVISIEDQRFISHSGVDFKRTIGAVLNFFMPGGGSYGGSTITQQLIKNVSGNDETTIQRKVQEIFRAFYVEKHYSKEQILEMYLNVIYLSQNTNGVKAAAEAYFGKDIKDLTLVECAALAAIPNSPTYYDPLRNPDHNLLRRNLILKEMLAQGYITQDEFDHAYNVPLYLSTRTEETQSTTDVIHSYYVDAVIEDVIDALMEKYDIDRSTASRRLYSGGLQIVTNVNPDIQKILEDVFVSDSSFPETSGIKPQSAMVVMDHSTGAILGIVGGRGEKTTNRGLNRATMSKRQCGSSIKPLSVYSYALENGAITYATSLEDTPFSYDEEEKSYWPPNAPVGYDGTVSLVTAIKRSKNTTAVRLADSLGVANCFEFLRDKAGISTLVESANYGGVIKSDVALSPMALGSFTNGVTVRDMAQAYTMFPNSGDVIEGRTFSVVRDSNGEIIIDNRVSEQTHAISEQTAYIMTKLLETVVTEYQGTAYTYFEGYYAERGCPEFYYRSKVEVAAKTGTTNDNRDLYFVGYTPDYVGAVWTGYDNNKSMGTLPYSPSTRLWIEVFNRIYGYLETSGIEYRTEFNEPYGIIEAEYCTISGKLATDACRCDIETVMTGTSCIRKGYFTYETVPKEECDCHVMFKWDKNTKAICVDGCTCPASSLVDAAFRRITPRVYKTNLVVTDSQYTCIDPGYLGSNYVYPSLTWQPYFFNIYTNGTFPGRSQGTNSFKPANRICIEHYSG